MYFFSHSPGFALTWQTAGRNMSLHRPDAQRAPYGRCMPKSPFCATWRGRPGHAFTPCHARLSSSFPLRPPDAVVPFSGPMPHVRHAVSSGATGTAGARGPLRSSLGHFRTASRPCRMQGTTPGGRVRFPPLPASPCGGAVPYPVMPCTETVPLRRRPATRRHFRLAGCGTNPVDDGSRLPILSGQARGGTMSFADIGSIVGGVVVLGLIGYFMYVKVLKH